MDPFALQHEARRHTGLLVFLACAALAMIIVAVAAIFAAACWCLWLSFGNDCGEVCGRGAVFVRLLASVGECSFLDFLKTTPQAVALSFALSSCFVLGGFFWKLFGLGSGDDLMRSVGAVQVRRSQIREGNDEDLRLLRLFNVCEEISIASGVDMPSVWVLPKDMEINAFVAGYSTSSPALCVTSGAVKYLERYELQGVIAHEFSHILNGDMELNFRLLALIAGITVVSRVGKLMASWFFPRFFGGGSGSRRSRGGGKGGGAILVILVVYLCTAAALWISGAVGVFFARLIQCAVSRKREYLADASAAQFTRNPEALANALRLSYLVSMRGGRTAFGVWREDVAHMLFTEGTRSVFATHPSVKDRIERLAPGSGLKTDAKLRERILRISEERERRSAAVEEEFRRKTAGCARGNGADVRTAAVGAVIPPFVRRQLSDPVIAGRAIESLLRGQMPSIWSGENTGPVRRRIALHCVTTLCDSGTDEERRAWAERVLKISEEDGQIDSFEFMVGVAMARRLDPSPSNRVASPILMRQSVARVVSTVADCGSDPERGYAAAGSSLSLFGGAGLPARPAPFSDSDEFAAELRRLSLLPPLAKRELMFGLKATVSQDGIVTEEESDYLVAVADAIGACGWLQVS